MKLALIVEGHGEVRALPILVRRLLGHLGAEPMPEILPPHRVPRGRLVKEAELQRAVELQARRVGVDGAILIVVDADDDCPAALGPRLVTWARAIRPDRRISTVVADREFETWFLASLSSLGGFRGLPIGISPPPRFEQLRDAKGWLHA